MKNVVAACLVALLLSGSVVGVAGAHDTPAPTSTAISAVRQVHIRFEYVKVTVQAKSPDKNELDALNILAEEGRAATLSTVQSRTGTQTRKQSITVTPRIGSDNVITLEIKEETQTTDASGESKTNASETRVRIKNGETKVVSGQITKAGSDGMERLLFVTPQIDLATP